MDTARAQIKCPACGRPAQPPHEKCPACGAALVKICSSCGAPNRLARDYCAKCGEPITELEPWEISGRQDDGAHSPPATIGDTIRAMRRNNPAWKFSLALSVALLVCLLAAGLAYLLLQPRIPGYRALHAGEKYLKALYSGRYDAAYAMLSSSARNNCSAEEFASYMAAHEGQGRQYRGLRVCYLKSDTAILLYKTRRGDERWLPAYLDLTLENGRWLHPDITTLVARADNALLAGNAQQSLALAQKMYETARQNPDSSGGLCQAQHALKLYEAAVVSCRQTINSATLYPSAAFAKHSATATLLLADSYRHLGRNGDALQMFSETLAQPDSEPLARCYAHMGKMVILAANNSYSLAGDEAKSALESCPPDLRPQANRYLTALEGNAPDEAIKLAQLHRDHPQDKPLLEQWQNRAAALADRKLRSPQQQRWVATHAEGPFYTVELRLEGGLDRRGRAAQQKTVAACKVNALTGDLDRTAF